MIGPRLLAVVLAGVLLPGPATAAAPVAAPPALTVTAPVSVAATAPDATVASPAVAGDPALAGNPALAADPRARQEPLRSLAAFTVTLTGTNVAGQLSLNATASPTVTGTGHNLMIWDSTTGVRVANCTSGTTCTATTVPTATTTALSSTAHVYVAVVAPFTSTYPPANVQGSGSWTAPAWTVTAVPTFASNAFTWTLTANYRAPSTTYRLYLWDITSGQAEGNCVQPSGSLSCTTGTMTPSADTTAVSMQPQTYVATVGGGNGATYPPTNVAATSSSTTLPAWTITLVATPNGTGIDLTARTNYEPTWAGYTINFWNLTTGKAFNACFGTGTGCTIFASNPAATYVATVGNGLNGTTWPQSNIAAVSGLVNGAGASGPVNTLETAGGSNPTELNVGQVSTADPVDVASGAFWSTTTDLAVPGRGVPLGFARTYDSRRASATGRLGFGWIDSYDWLLTKDAATGLVTVRHGNGSQSVFTPIGGGRYTSPSRVLAVLVQNADGTYTYTIRHRTSWTFDAAGKPTKVTDLNGYVTALGYDTSGRLATVTDPANRKLTIAYGTGNRISTVTDPLLRKVTYTYDAAGNLDTVTDVDNRRTSFDYDGAHQLTTVTNPRTHTLVNTYVSGRVSQQKDWQGKLTTFTYTGTAGNGTTTVTHPRGNKGVYTFSRGLRTQVVKGSGTADAVTEKFEFDPLTNGLTKFTDGLNHSSTATFDPSGNTLTQTDALNRQTVWTYNQFDQPLTMKDPSGVTTTYTYDAKGNRRFVSRPLVETGETATYEFVYGDAAHPGDVTRIIDPNRKSIVLGYDTYGNRTSVTDATNRKTTRTFNVVGWLTSEVSPAGNATGGVPAQHTTTYSNFTGFGAAKTTTDAAGRATTFGYDANQNLTDVTDADGRHTTKAYDNNNRPTVVTRPDTTTTRTTYDDNGNVASQIDGLTHATTYGYDNLDRLTSITDALGRATRFTYDAASNWKTIVTGTGATALTTTAGYNVADERTSVSYSDGTTRAIGFTYDLLGRRKTMTDATGTTTYTIDSLGRLSQTVTGTGKTVRYGYDLGSRLTAITYPNGQQVVRGHDDAGRLNRVTDWLGNATTFGYDADGSLKTTTYANGVVGTRGRDNSGELMSIGYTKGTTGLGTYTYTRTTAGLLQTSTPSAGAPGPAATYAYTPNAQLKSTTGPSATAVWAYDAADRLIKDPLGTTLAYNNADQLMTATPATGATTTYTYDNRGNRLTAKVGTATAAGYTWDQTGALTRYTSPTGTATTYTYTGDGLRATKTPAGGSAQVSVWDQASQEPALLLTDGTSSFIYGPGGVPIEQITGSTPTYLHQDQLGSTALITNSAGAVTGTYSYDPYGKSTPAGTATTPLQFNGQYTDGESGMVYLRARYYDPARGQFISVDPIAPVTRSRYGYAVGNPLSFTDPSGLITSGLCFGSSFGVWSAAFKGSFCFVGAFDERTGESSFGATLSTGHGWALPATLGVDAAYQITNARTVDQLDSENDWYGGVGVGGLPGGGIELSGGPSSGGASCGAPDYIWGGEVQLRARGPLPVEAYWGKEDTKAWQWGSFNLIDWFN